jgi:hypothetical protein
MFLGTRYWTIIMFRQLTIVGTPHQRGKHPGGDPAPALLVDRLPGWKLPGQVAPGGAGMHDPAQGVEDLAQVVTPLRGIFGHQRQIRRHEGPFLVADIGRVRLAGATLTFHPPSLPSP